VINNVDDVLLFLLVVTCDQQHCTIGPFMNFALRPYGRNKALAHHRSVCPSYMATEDMSRSQILPSAVDHCSVIADGHRSIGHLGTDMH